MTRADHETTVPEVGHLDISGKITCPAPPEPVVEEPVPGSVVLIHSCTGTAWQRHFADGLWYSTARGRTKPGLTWDSVAALDDAGAPPFLIYDAAPHLDH